MNAALTILRDRVSFILVVLYVTGLWGANYLSNIHTQHEQRQQSMILERRLCSDLDTMANIPPPNGAAESNPSRAYEQAEHRTWYNLAHGFNCLQANPTARSKK